MNSTLAFTPSARALMIGQGGGAVSAGENTGASGSACRGGMSTKGTSRFPEAAVSVKQVRRVEQPAQGGFEV
ncbi:hypothetical protein [Streptomyces sp. NPDC047097]|uniref:hypothetical protein n=1 Tax=Streptomyces sp. NPDC047097 TaxID=3155260 RepID=UPI0034003AD1